MCNEHEAEMKCSSLTRRDFMRSGAVGAAGLAMAWGAMAEPDATVQAAIQKTRSYKPEMEYRRLGKTGLWVSAVCMGGHWKRLEDLVPGAFKSGGWLDLDVNHPEFQKNRHEVVSRCIEHGINLIDACTWAEVQAYSKALEGRRDQMYLNFSWYEHEARQEDRRTAERLLQTLDEGMQACKLDYVDVWRITCISDGSKDADGNPVLAHTPAESEQIAKALAQAKQAGKARHTGVSSHDRLWLTMMMEKFPNEIEVVVTPYTASSKELPQESMFDAVKKNDCGVLGIKPFASNSLFKGDSSLASPDAEEDDRLARMAIRYILCNPGVTAPIPGLINTHQVDNVAAAIKERRELDAAEAKKLAQAMDAAWQNLPAEYEWLKDWEYV